MKKLTVLILSLYLLIAVSFVQPVQTNKEPKTATEVSIDATKDSYTDSKCKNSNFGEVDNLKAGKCWCRSTHVYFYFPINPDLGEYTGAEVKLYFWAVYHKMEFEIYIIEDTIWDEYTLTWDNCPCLGEFVTELTIETSGYYVIDLLEYIADRDGISICVCGKYSGMGFCNIDSREDSEPERRPQLIASYVPSESGSIFKTGAGGVGDHGNNGKETDEVSFIPLLIIILSSIAVGSVALIIAWKKQLFSKRIIHKKQIEQIEKIVQEEQKE
ncbi:MAG: hypothetical protein ACFFAO_01315 [Candidatus Hermodarchaeota archaeon]